MHRSVRVPEARVGTPLRRPCAAGRHRRRPGLPCRRQRTSESPGSPIEHIELSNLFGSTSRARPMGGTHGERGTLHCASAWTTCCSMSLDEAQAAVDAAECSRRPRRHAAPAGGLPGGVGRRRHLRTEPRRPGGGIDRGRRVRPGILSPGDRRCSSRRPPSGWSATKSRSAYGRTRRGTRLSRSSAWYSSQRRDLRLRRRQRREQPHHRG